MRFFKSTVEYENFPVGTVFCYSFYHNGIVKVATPSDKIEYNLSWYDNQFRQDVHATFLDYTELLKLKPHINKTILRDYELELRTIDNNSKLAQLTHMCCYECANKVFKTNIELKPNTIGKCFNCGKEKLNLFYKDRFISH